jgi:DnaK suppressor protein
VSGKTLELEDAFIQRQRDQLIKLREALAPTIRAGEAEEAEVQLQSIGEASESEDDAQKLAMLEIDGTVVAQNMLRLTRVERALQKIEEGTYGISDRSGEHIPRERLEAMPESIHTLSEVEARESTHEISTDGTNKRSQ